MKVTVEPKTVAGTRRGGEDLFLVFKAHGEPSVDFVVEPVSGDPSWDLEGDGPNNVWKCTTGHCEFEWEGTLEDLHQLALDAGVTNPARWVWYGKATEEPKRRFYHEHFVEGNAE